MGIKYNHVQLIHFFPFTRVFGIVVVFMVVVWKKFFIKSIFGWGWFGIYICLVKTVIEIEVQQKII